MAIPEQGELERILYTISRAPGEEQATPFYG
jgi:hypothetical protein